MLYDARNVQLPDEHFPFQRSMLNENCTTQINSLHNIQQMTMHILTAFESCAGSFFSKLQLIHIWIEMRIWK